MRAKLVKSGVIGFMGLTRREVQGDVAKLIGFASAMLCSYSYALTFRRRCGKRWLSNEPG